MKMTSPTTTLTRRPSRRGIGRMLAIALAACALAACGGDSDAPPPCQTSLGYRALGTACVRTADCLEGRVYCEPYEAVYPSGLEVYCRPAATILCPESPVGYRSGRPLCTAGTLPAVAFHLSPGATTYACRSLPTDAGPPTDAPLPCPSSLGYREQSTGCVRTADCLDGRARCEPYEALAPVGLDVYCRLVATPTCPGGAVGERNGRPLCTAGALPGVGFYRYPDGTYACRSLPTDAGSADAPSDGPTDAPRDDGPEATADVPRDLGVDASAPDAWPDAPSDAPASDVLAPPDRGEPFDARPPDVTADAGPDAPRDAALDGVEGSSDVLLDAADASSDAPASDVPTSSGGAIRIVTPTSVREGRTESDSALAVFSERRSDRPTTQLQFSAHVPGSYPGDTLSPGRLAAGAEVDTWFVHFDPVGRPTTAVSWSGSITFPDEILAVVFDAESLQATDPFAGSPTVDYPGTSPPAFDPDRGLDLSQGDRIVFEPDRRTLRLTLSTSNSTDQIRVYTTGGRPAPLVYSGTAALRPATGSVATGQVASNLLQIVPERSVTLATPLSIDLGAAGTYTRFPSGVSPLPAGRGVAAWLAVFDIDDSSPADRGVVASVTFPRPVVGIAAQAASLDASDRTLGAPTVAYPSPGAEPDRGVELDAAERIEWLPDQRSVRFRLAVARRGADHARVVTSP